MRTITGEIILPEKTPAVNAGQVIIEVRDISLADVPSQLIAEKRLDNVALKPHGRINFSILVPEVEANRTLTLRVHISLDGSGRMKSGDLLTTATYPIPNTGTPAPLEVPVVVI
jgi:putative lipoprotein